MEKSRHDKVFHISTGRWETCPIEVVVEAEQGTWSHGQ
jgi:hypothetical protein